MKLLDVPFYVNDGDGQRCYQVAMRGAIKYFLGKEVSAEEADELTHRKPNKWTFASQIVPVMYDMGLDVKFYSKDPLEPLLTPEKTLREQFGNEVYERDIEKFLDIPVITESVSRILNTGLFERRQLDLHDLEGFLLHGYLPMANVNWRKLVGRDGFSGHFVTVTGFDEENIYCHQPGAKDPTPNWKVPRDIFRKAWTDIGCENEIVLVKGKR